MNLNRDEITATAERLQGKVIRTKVISIEPRLSLKLESEQHSGSFKARGAINAMLCSDVGPDGVVAASGGNHGAAVAWAAQALGYRANIFVPSIISQSKLERLQSYEAEIHVVGNEYQQSLEAARSFQVGRQCIELHAYDQTEIVLGAGTIAAEIDDQASEATTIIVACGGGLSLIHI